MGTLREGTAVTSAADLKRRSHSPQTLDMGLHGKWEDIFQILIHAKFTLLSPLVWSV